MNQIAYALADGAVVAKRNLIKIKRVPEILIWTLMSPIMFVLLFAYVFGSAINFPGMSYREFLLPGIIAQTVIFGSTFTGAGMAEDMTKGVIDRFRSLPMTRSSVLIGRTASDIVYNLLSMITMCLTGLIIGWRIHNGVGKALAAFALLLLFAYAFSWIMAYVGLIVPSVEVVNNASFMVIFPLTFIADTFVPTAGLPTALRVFAEWNPVSSVARAARGLWGNPVAVPGVPEPTAWSLQHPVLYTLIWVAVILAIFVPLSTRQYKKAASR
jgi:ABC-2 type transport system permease protein